MMTELKNNKESGVQLTTRDIEIIKFINEFGFCILPQINKRFGIRSKRAYQIMDRLKKVGFVIHKRVFHSHCGIYYLTPYGAEMTDLPPLKNIPVGIYDHQLMVVNVYLKLRVLYPEMEWISERQLKQVKYFNGVGKGGHVADGILILPDEKKIAIEVELTKKGGDRLERIMKGYTGQFSIKAVWYYCPKKLTHKLSAAAKTLHFIKIYSIEDFLS